MTLTELAQQIDAKRLVATEAAKEYEEALDAVGDLKARHTMELNASQLVATDKQEAFAAIGKELTLLYSAMQAMINPPKPKDNGAPDLKELWLQGQRSRMEWGDR